MSVVAITSSRTSPGATTLATGLAIAWSHLVERSLLIEADPAGGVLALRFDMMPAPSLTSFASDVRNKFESDHVWANTQDLRGAYCMPAPVDPRLARSWIERVAPTLIEELPRLGAPTVIDLGWVDESGASAPLVKAADTTLILTTPDIAEVQGLLFQIRRLRDQGAENIALVTVGSTPTDPQEVAAVAGVPLAAVLPHDPQVAAALTGSDFKASKFRRSLLWRTISGLATSLFDEQLLVARAALADVPQAVQAPSAQPTYPAPTYVPLAEPAAPAPAPAPVVVASFTPQPQPEPVPAPAAPVHSAEPDFIDPGLFDETKRLPQYEVATLVDSDGNRTGLQADVASLIGRHSSCSIALHDSQVSRRHGRITRAADGWHYADLGSRNGSDINGQPCVDTLLRSGDVLTIGRTQLTFELISTREMESA